ncbi:MAG: isocitrate lyase/phosphoenolpyruvate mutase family protein [Methylobacterium sp.]|nr:isocitrate lyase/phosphoenolpyruvate mutase family protein [Methylobacterium sp.]MCA3639470.1 isocitrate lyase/phosphoenolpyruvate mutase family protein [Methylobacterium sp.]MCA3646859.1 isocitrate lyase/phosphoenolpyruvate mutase family protein [Methylobacterium sp.]MCA3650813.1 isocitrate lyase/phosphoenolpyruvate mutase family protein [Methylobacterium sp.]MCA4922746.1 isocitrate lyase/phosphoenolpyruvate mutase family protein [Methylobacterium sp.]
MSLRCRLSRPEIVVAPGVYDALTASLAEAAGFGALYLSGAAMAYTRLGGPDLGLVTMSETAEAIRLIRERVKAPLIVDGDTGYGNALNVERTVRAFERAGANAIQIEDQTFPKRCGHLADKSLVSREEMAGKIRAAAASRGSQEFLIIARTDAVAVEGLDAALARADAYLEAGADLLFVEAPRDHAMLSTITARLGNRAPLMANMVEGGLTPMLDARELQALGYRLVIFPGGIVRAVAKTAEAYYASLAAHGTNAPFRDRMFDFNELNQRMGTVEALRRAAAYDREESR